MERYSERAVRLDPRYPRSYAYTTDSALYKRELFFPEPVQRRPTPYFYQGHQKMEQRAGQPAAAVNDDKDEKTFKNLMLKFMGYTSAHGIGRLGESKTIFWKIFWSLICLGAFGMFIFQAYGLFTLYLSRPVSTSVKITFEKQLPFPSVTICNLNMIRNEAMPSQVKEALKTKLRYDYDYSIKGSGEGSGGQYRSRRDAASDPADTKSDDSDYDYYGDNTKDYYDNYDSGSAYEYDKDENEDIGEDYPDPEAVDRQTRLREEIALLIGQLDSDGLYYSGHLFKDMVVNCSWKGLDCTTGNLSEHWTNNWNYKFGNCYTFNSGFDANDKKMRILKTSKPGPSQGLTLHLNIEQSKYIGPITIEAGVRVLLHDQGVMPFPYEEGFSVAPGMATSIGIKNTKIVRLDRFGNNSCWSDSELPRGNIYRRFKNITRYSQQACLNSCLGLSQWFQCNCSENAYPSSGKPCDIFDSQTLTCLRKVKFLFNNDRLKCLHDCRQSCTEEVIQKTISSSQWPSKAHQKYLITQGQAKNESDSALLLNIFYNELNYEKIEEEYSYGSINLLADIGGQLGLWIGISVITCCEVLELFMKFFSRIIMKCNAASQAQVGVAVPPYGYR